MAGRSRLTLPCSWHYLAVGVGAWVEPAGLATAHEDTESPDGASCLVPVRAGGSCRTRRRTLPEQLDRSPALLGLGYCPSRNGDRRAQHRALTSRMRAAARPSRASPRTSRRASTSESYCGAARRGAAPFSAARSNVSGQFGRWARSPPRPWRRRRRACRARPEGRLLPVLGQRPGIEVDERTEPLRPSADHGEHQRRPVARGADRRLGAPAGAEPGRKVTRRKGRGQDDVHSAVAGTCPTR